MRSHSDQHRPIGAAFKGERGGTDRCFVREELDRGFRHDLDPETPPARHPTIHQPFPLHGSPPLKGDSHVETVPDPEGLQPPTSNVEPEDGTLEVLPALKGLAQDGLEVGLGRGGRVGDEEDLESVERSRRRSRDCSPES